MIYSMRCDKVAAFVLGLAVPLLAQTAATPERQVSGVVLDAVSGVPIRRAYVQLSSLPGLEGVLVAPSGVPELGTGARPVAGPNREVSAYTDDSGRFDFGRIPAGAVNLRIARQGYTAEMGVAAFDRLLSVSEDSRDLVIKLVPLGAIEGRVLDANGEPLAGLEVQALTMEIFQGRREARVVSRKTTDDRGEYRLWHLAQGRYLLRVAQANRTIHAFYEPASRTEEDLAPASVYYPNAPGQASAQVLRLAPGVEERADFTLVRQRVYRIRGTVPNYPRGTPGTIRLLSGDDDAGCIAMLNPASGSFEVGMVPPGSYTLRITTSNSAAPGVAEAPVTVGGRDVNGLAMQLGYGVDVGGVIRFAGGVAPPERGSLIIQAEPSSRTRVPGASQVLSVSLSGEGAFALKGLLPGTYAIRLYLPAGFYAASITSGQTDVLSKGLTVGSASPEPLTIEVAAGTARIEGTVTGLPEGKNGMLAVVRPGVFLGSPDLISTKADGKFTLPGLAPGHVVLFAWVLPGEIEYANPDLADRGVSLNLQNGAAERVEIAVRHAEEY